MPLNITKKAVVETPGGNLVETMVAAVSIKHPDGAVETKDPGELPVLVGPGPFANVGIRAKVTINLGNYENVQIEVSLHLPSPNDPGEILTSFNYASAWIDARMTELSEKYTPKK